MNTLPASKGFLGLPETEACDYTQAKAVIIPFGLEASVSYGGGTANGPRAMIHASHEVELFDEELWCEPYKQIGVATLSECTISQEHEPALNQLENLVESVLADNKFPFVFGGEHSLTAGAIRPFSKKYHNLVILHFDAHADLRDGYAGIKYSHASALRRCLDNPDLSLISLGIRNISAEEIPFLTDNQHRIKVYWAKDKKKWQLSEILSHLKNKNIYLTFDVDCFDASLMPATGTPEPGGLFWDEVIEIIRGAAQAGTIVGADINELAPIEMLHGCDFLAAKLAYKILSYVFCKPVSTQLSAAKTQIPIKNHLIT